MSAYDEVTDALHRAGSTQKGHDWTCPAHKGGAEKRPSLSVNEGDKGVVMTCHQGCDNADVLRAIGLKDSDLFDEKLTPTKKEIKATYDYQDVDGKLLYQVVRYEPKEFRQRRPKDGGGWDWSVKGIERVPFHLPQLVEAVAAGQPVYIVEGEKDVLAIERAGGVATCNSGGAGKWSDDFAKYFKDADVTIIRDLDQPGLRHAFQVKASLEQVAHNIEIAAPIRGKDAADHLGAGMNLGDFRYIEDDTPVEEVEEEQDGGLQSRLLEIDDIDNIPPPQYLIGDFIVANSLAVLYGQPGHGKSFIALDWALSMAHDVGKWMNKSVAAGPVIYLVAEGLAGYGIRKKAWRKAHPVHTKGDLHWLRDPVNLLDKQQVEDLVDLCNRYQPMLLVIDTLGRCMPGADENAPGPMSEAIEALDRIRRETRACVLLVHHSPKDGGTPRGHSSLLGAVQTSISVKLVEGVITLTVEKQKDGAPTEMRLRLQAVEQSAVLEAFGDGPVSVPRSAMNEKAVLSALSDYALHGGASIVSVMEETGMSRSVAFRTLKELMEAQRVMRHGQKYLPI